MKFYLNYIPAKPDYTISYFDKICLTGSCFTENIGSYLNDHKFNTLINPSGILFNPISIYNSLFNALNKQTDFKASVLKRDNRYFSFNHHSAFSASTEDELIEKMNKAEETLSEFIKHGDYLIITFGTAYYYLHKALNSVVANCHKQPGTHFTKQICEPETIVTLYSELISNINHINPKLKIIFTVSPVKHLRDGVTENALSKATLLLIVNKLCGLHSNAFYFPAYELVTDDLRDYRFYKEDLAHPNEQAIQYVWEKFCDCFFNNATKNLIDKIFKLNSALAHRSINENAEEKEKLQKYINNLKEQINAGHAGVNLNN